MKSKTIIKVGITAALALAVIGSLAGCGGAKEWQIAVPSDTTNEARALLLLQDQGLIKLKDGAGLEATANDIVDNPYNIKIVETEAANLPRTVQDVSMAVINGNYALSAGLDPSTVIVGESDGSEAAEEYANVIAVRAADLNSEKTKALVETLQSDEVKQFIEDTYSGVVVPVAIKASTDLSEPAAAATAADKVIKVGASPAPHSEILGFAKTILAQKGYTLEIVEFSDYIQPNVALNDGQLDANYFQHLPYLENYNVENGTDLASAAKIHFEPLSLYPGKVTNLEDIKK